MHYISFFIMFIANIVVYCSATLDSKLVFHTERNRKMLYYV